MAWGGYKLPREILLVGRDSGVMFRLGKTFHVLDERMKWNRSDDDPDERGGQSHFERRYTALEGNRSSGF